MADTHKPDRLQSPLPHSWRRLRIPLYEPLRFTTAYLAKLAGTRAVLIDYHLAPEYPFPMAVHDCVQAYRWLITDGKVLPEQIVFTGESAGGNLVVTTLLALRDAGDPLPVGAVAMYPPFDFEGQGTFYTQEDPMADAEFVMRHLTAYRGNVDPHTPLLSPLYADLQGLPPLLIQVGEAELFRSGAEALATRAEQAGVAVKLHIWPGMWHFWHLFVPRLPEAQQAMVEIRDFVHACPLI